MYDDGLIAITADQLVIRRYYFPWAGSKRIPLSAIRELRCSALPNGSGRFWGSGDFVHWANLDLGRTSKRFSAIVDNGHKVKPIVTPDDPSGFVKEMEAHQVTVTGHVPGDQD